MLFIDTILLFEENDMAEFQVYETHNLSNSLLPFIYHTDFVRTGPGLRINWHENIEFLFCTSGNGYIQCGSEIYPFSPNDLFVVNADTLHTIGGSDRVTYQCLIVDNSFFTDNGIPISDLFFQNIIRDPQLTELFIAVSKAYGSFNPKEYCSTLAIRSAVLSFLLLLCQNYTTVRPSSAATNPAVKEAIVYIRSNLTAHISLDHLSAHTGLSKYHLSRQFKIATGNTIIDYINLTRCTEAKGLIENGSSISAAALACGFENLSYFTRTYKKFLGELPSASAHKRNRT